MSDHTKHEAFIRQAIALADSAVQHGNHPFGALLVHNDRVVASAENTVVTNHNPTQHAEMNLVNAAWQSATSTSTSTSATTSTSTSASASTSTTHSLTPEVIKECTLYTSCEPCPMCTGAIFWSGIRRVVYSCPAVVLGEIANDKFCQSCSDLFDRADDKTEVIGPVLEEEGVRAHKAFW